MRWLDLLDRAFAPVIWPAACDTWLPKDEPDATKGDAIGEIPPVVLTKPRPTAVGDETKRELTDGVV